MATESSDFGQYRPCLKDIQYLAEDWTDMSGPARRDLVWDAVLRCIISNPASIRLRDVQHYIAEDDVSDRTVRRTMSAMLALGWLEKDKEGGHYWFPGPKAREWLPVPSSESFAQTKSTSETGAPVRQVHRGYEVMPAPEEQVETDEFEVAISEATVSGQGELARRRREVFGMILEFLREEQKSSPAAIREQFFEGNEVGYSSETSWWKNFAYPALRDCDLVESGGEGSHTWFYVGEV